MPIGPGPIHESIRFRYLQPSESGRCVEGPCRIGRRNGSPKGREGLGGWATSSEDCRALTIGGASMPSFNDALQGRRVEVHCEHLLLGSVRPLGKFSGFR